MPLRRYRIVSPVSGGNGSSSGTSSGTSTSTFTLTSGTAYGSGGVQFAGPVSHAPTITAVGASLASIGHHHHHHHHHHTPQQQHQQQQHVSQLHPGPSQSRHHQHRQTAQQQQQQQQQQSHQLLTNTHHYHLHHHHHHHQQQQHQQQQQQALVHHSAPGQVQAATTHSTTHYPAHQQQQQQQQQQHQQALVAHQQTTVPVQLLQTATPIVDPLPLCLDANGTYLCTSYNPRCYIIQKLTPTPVSCITYEVTPIAAPLVSQPQAALTAATNLTAPTAASVGSNTVQTVGCFEELLDYGKTSAVATVPFLTPVEFAALPPSAGQLHHYGDAGATTAASSTTTTVETNNVISLTTTPTGGGTSGGSISKRTGGNSQLAAEKPEVNFAHGACVIISNSSEAPSCSVSRAGAILSSGSSLSGPASASGNELIDVMEAIGASLSVVGCDESEGNGGANASNTSIVPIQQHSSGGSPSVFRVTSQSLAKMHNILQPMSELDVKSFAGPNGASE
uniref:Uncharacterized protein n=1 Tax=Anopheles atroparvus TaxID=41427 RepID=A0AAG5DCA8_ANOAO